jgi:multidrug resistance efflux pump
MSQELEMRILAKVDEALAEIRRLSEQATEALEEIKNANEQVAEVEEETTASARELALGFSGLVGSGVSLYVGLTNLERANYQVERAHYLVKKAAEDVEVAQRKYNEAVAKYGPESEKAQAAAKELQMAQERYQLAVERASNVAGPCERDAGAFRSLHCSNSDFNGQQRDNSLPKLPVGGSACKRSHELPRSQPD